MSQRRLGEASVPGTTFVQSGPAGARAEAVHSPLRKDLVLLQRQSAGTASHEKRRTSPGEEEYGRIW